MILMDADYRVNTLELRDALKPLSKVGKDKNNYTFKEFNNIINGIEL